MQWEKQLRLKPEIHKRFEPVFVKDHIDEKSAEDWGSIKK
jgi:hypothetical protein